MRQIENESQIRDADEAYPRLKANVELRAAAVACLIMDLERNVEPKDISPLRAVILALCNGARSASTIAGMLPKRLAQAAGELVPYVRATLRAYADYLSFDDAAQPASERYQPADFLYVPTPTDALGRYSAPIKGTFVLTSRCNFRCVYCYNDSGVGRARELTTTQWLSAVDQLADMGAACVFLTGGEPMVHPGFFEISQRVTQRGMYVSLTTNGSLIDEAAARRMRDIGFHVLTVSLDTPDRDLHHQLTGTSDTFARVIGGIQALIKAGLHVRVKAILMPKTMDRTVELVRFLADLGVDNVAFDPFHAQVNGRGEDGFILDQQQYAKAAATLGNASFAIPCIVKPLGTYWRDERDCILCGALSRTITLMSDGNCCSCEALQDDPHFRVGIFPEQTIDELWHSARVRDVFYSKVQSQQLEPCKSCPLWTNCMGGCPANKLLMRSPLNGPDPYCFRAGRAGADGLERKR